MQYREYNPEHPTLMVFLHGGGVSSWMWDEQVNYFSSRHHCLIPDLPGHGRSRSGSFSIQDSAEQVIQLISEVAPNKKVIVIGFSLGAQILVKMLSIKEDLIDVAIINSALTKPMAVGSKLLMPILKISFPLVKWKSFAKLQAKELYIHEEQFPLYFEDSANTNLNSFIQVMKENMSFSIPPRYSKTNAKILVTVGEKEKKIMRDSAVELVKENANAKGIIIPNVGHGIPLVNPTYFNQMVENWIESESLPSDAKRIEVAGI